MGDDKAASGGTAVSQIPVDKSTGETKMQTIEVTLGHAAEIWWAWFWRAFLFSSLFGLGVGFIVGLVGAIVGLTPLVRNTIIWFFALPSGILISIWVLSNILKKRFRNFRIALVQN